MKDNSRFIDSLNDELWPKSRSSLSSSDLKEKIYEDFKVYFENESMLKMAVDAGFFNYDYNFYSKNFKGNIFESFLTTIIGIYRSAKKTNPEECYSFLMAHQPVVSNGFQNTTDIAYTEHHKGVERLNLYAKVCFREIGDFIEGSFQPLVKELFGLHLLKHKNSSQTLELVSEADLGKAVTILMDNYEDLSILYKHVLNGVSLNQWRNIAQHKSYFANEANNEIRCTYGKKNHEKTIVLTRDELGRIYIGIINIQYLHKIAHAIFVTDNVMHMPKICSEKTISEDTAIMQSVETLSSIGFKVIKLEKDNDWIILEAQDTESRRLEQVEQSIKDIVPLLFSLVNSLSLTVLATNGVPAFNIKSSPNKSQERTGDLAPKK